MTDYLVDDDEIDGEEAEIEGEEPPAFNDDEEDEDEEPPSESLMSMMLDSTPRPAGTNFSCK